MSVSPETEAEIRRLHYAEHFKVHTICTALAVHHEVVERVLGLRTRPKPAPRPTALDPYKEFLREQLVRYPRLRATRLYDMLVARGYRGSPRSVRAFVQQERPKATPTAFVHCNPLCGEQAQVDWAHVGNVPVPGGQRPLWVFVLVLSYSRALFAELVFDLTVSSLCRSLLRAAQFFGGLPRQFLFDNPKTVVLERHGDQVRFQPELLALCAQLHVQPRLCAVYAPQQKGRVERAVRYLRDRFFAGRTLVERERGNQELLVFLRTLPGQRPHPTLKERTVQQVFDAQERPTLLALPTVLPTVELCIPVQLDKYAHFQFDSNRYSAPPRYAQGTLTLCASDSELRLLDKHQEVARHPRCWGRGQRCTLRAHEQELLVKRPAARMPTAQDRLRRAFPKMDQLLGRWLQQGSNVGLLTLRAHKLLDLYGAERFARAAALALERDTTDPAALAQLLEQLRKQEMAPVPIPLALGSHVPDNDVLHHPLESYDDIDEELP